MFEPTFFEIYFFIECCYLPCTIVVSPFMLLAALFYLKPKAQNFALFLLLHYFLLYRFTYGQSIGCIVHS